jgi:predicted ATPase
MMSASVLDRHAALVQAGELRPDADQVRAVGVLANVQSKLEAAPARGRTVWRFLGRKPEPARGLYLWGGVGRGKSMLMDQNKGRRMADECANAEQVVFAENMKSNPPPSLIDTTGMGR